MKNLYCLFFVVFAFTACSVDPIDQTETDFLSADFEATSFTGPEADGFITTSFDLIHENAGNKGAVHVTNDCDNLYIQIVGDEGEANLGLYTEMTDFPEKKGAKENVSPGNLEYNQDDAADFLWTFPLSDFEADGIYIFVNSGAAWGGDQTHGSAKYFHYNFQECVVAENCTYGYGFWRNHNPIDNPGNQDNEWPSVTELYLGNTSYNIEELVSILKANVGGNGFVSLAHHLIAAKLNIANGADNSEIASVIEAADNLIGDLEFGTEELSMNKIGELQAALEAFNEGSNNCGGEEEPWCGFDEDVYSITVENSYVDESIDQVGQVDNFLIEEFFGEEGVVPMNGTFDKTNSELLGEYKNGLGNWPIIITTDYTVGEGDCKDSTTLILTITE